MWFKRNSNGNNNSSDSGEEWAVVKYTGRTWGKLRNDVFFYEVLGVAKDASVSEIREAYRRKARELHPDKNRGSEEHHREKFIELNRAYTVLTNEDKRVIYDRFGYSGLILVEDWGPRHEETFADVARHRKRWMLVAACVGLISCCFCCFCCCGCCSSCRKKEENDESMDKMEKGEGRRERRRSERIETVQPLGESPPISSDSVSDPSKRIVVSIPGLNP